MRKTKDAPIIETGCILNLKNSKRRLIINAQEIMSQVKLHINMKKNTKNSKIKVLSGNKLKPLKSILSNKNSTCSENTAETHVKVRPGHIRRMQNDGSESSSSHDFDSSLFHNRSTAQLKNNYTSNQLSVSCARQEKVQVLKHLRSKSGPLQSLINTKRIQMRSKDESISEQTTQPQFEHAFTFKTIHSEEIKHNENLISPGSILNTDDLVRTCSNTISVSLEKYSNSLNTSQSECSMVTQNLNSQLNAKRPPKFAKPIIPNLENIID